MVWWWEGAGTVSGGVGGWRASEWWCGWDGDE